MSQHWPMAVPTQLPVPVPSHDLLLSSYEVCASHENVLIILILSAPAYTANPIFGPTHTTPLKSQALQVVRVKHGCRSTCGMQLTGLTGTGTVAEMLYPWDTIPISVVSRVLTVSLSYPDTDVAR